MNNPASDRCFFLLLVMFLLAVPVLAAAQGTILFANRAPTISTTFQVTYPDGRGVGADFMAQLYGGPATLPEEDLTPLFPTTTFRSGPAAGYVNPVIVAVPGVLPTERAKVFMRVFDGPTWESSTYRGDSIVSIMVVGGGQFPPAGLIGPEAFSVKLVPEPSTLAFIGCGIVFLFALRQSRSSGSAVQAGSSPD
jgi:hypothetical protein